MKKIYSKVLIGLLFVLGTIAANAQIGITVTNPGNTTPALSASYTSLADALTQVNSVTAMTGPVILTLNAGASETAPATGFNIGSATLNPVLSAVNTITIVKAAGAATTLNAGVGTALPNAAIQDGILKIVGADYITIDGITFADGNVANPATMEFGIGLFKLSLSDGAQNNTIRNCIITMNAINNATGSGPSVEGSKAINVVNATDGAQITSLVPTTAAGTNSSNKFYSNSIQNCNYGIVLNGYAAATPFTAGDTGNDIGGASAGTGNTIINFGGAAAATNPAAGIRANNQWGINISYNTIDNNDGSGANHVNTIRGIYAQAGTSANATINNNTVSIKSGATTSACTAIENAIGSTAAGNTVNINNNNITGEYLTATSGLFYGIFNSASAATVNLSDNNVHDISYSDASLTGTGAIYVIYNSGAATNATANNNTVQNISRTGSTGGTTIGIYFSSGATQTVTNNTVNNLSIDGTGTASIMYGIQTATGTIACNFNTVSNLNCIKTTGTGVLYGIYNVASPTIESFSDNTIFNITHAGTGVTYGLYTNTTTGSRTTARNVIHNISSGGLTVAGISSLSSSPTMFKNKIYNIFSTSTGAPTVSGMILGSLGTAGVFNVYNNIIGDIRAESASSTGPAAPSVRGINITTATVLSTINLSYNSVYLNATSSGAEFSTAALFVTSSATSTTAALQMRNNIFVNGSTFNGTGNTVAYQRSSTALDNYGASSNNNLFYAGTPGANNLIFYDGTNADETLAAYKIRVAARDNSSVSEEAPFLSTTGSNANFLHIDPAVATQIESGGIPITGITDDFDGNSRNAGTPDIGADEGTFTLADLNGPGITYTTFANTLCTTNRTLNATISDASGVNITAGTKPRIYYKKTSDANNGLGGTNDNTTDGWKYTEASNAASPFSFTIDYSLLSGAAGAGDIIQYFIVAQDLAGTPNVGINSGTFAAMPAGVNLTAGAFPIGGTINSYALLAAVPTTITIGAAGTYTSLTGAGGLFADINAKGLSANTTVTILDASVAEDGTNALNQMIYGCSGTYTLTIKPATGVSATLTGSSAAALIKFNGADNVMIDGSNNGTNSRNLTIENTATTAGSAAIWISSLGAGAGASNNTIKNAIIRAGSNTVTTYGIAVSGLTVASTGADNANITIQNNHIQKADNAIYAQGVTTSGELTGLIITQNKIGADVATDYVTGYGMYITNANAPSITLNEVYNMIYNGSKYGIWFGTTVHDAIISRNKVHTFNQANTTAYYSIGIYFSSTTGCSNNQIDNNAIYNLNNYGSTSNFYLVGIRIVGGTNYKIYHNTISMSGAFGSASAGCYATCLFVSTASTGMDIRNNILFNERTGTTPKAYTLHTVSSTTFTNINYNSYYSTGDALGFVIAEVADLAALRIATAGDANSIGTNPLLNSSTNVQPGIGSPALGAGDNSTGITIDIAGVTRNNPPTIGAYEIAADAAGPVITYTTLENTLCTTDRTLSASITDASGLNITAGTMPRLYFKKTSNANTFNDNTNGTDGWKYTEATNTISPFNFTTNYSLVNGAVAAGDIIQYFVVAQDISAIPNVGINSGTFAATPSSVALTSAAFPLTGTINQYTWTTGGLSSDVTIGAAGTYPTLTGVGGLFEAINTSGLTNNITASILDAAITETGAVSLNAITYGCAGSYTLLVKPAAGVTTVISGTVATTSMINLNGADNITFDGSNNGTSSKDMTFRNSSTTGAVIRLINDATFNTVKNSILEGGVTSTTSGVVAFSTSTGTLGNSNNTIMNNDIRDKTDVVAAFANGIYSSGTAGGLNASNTISGNNIFNFTANGMNLTSTGIGNSWQITGNSFYNDKVTPPATAQTSILVSGGSSHLISGNFIGGNAANAGGSAWSNTGSVAFTGINLAGVGAAGAVSVQNNTIQNISLTATGSGAFTGILVSGASTVNAGTVTGNTVGHALNANSIQTSALSAIIGMSSTSTAAVNFSNNTVANITSTGATTAVGVRGISHTGSGTLVISDNTIKNISAANATTSITTSALLGIYSASSSTGQVITNNTISGLILSHPTAANYVQAINLNAANTVNAGTVRGNKIFDIQNTSTGSPFIIGIDLYVGTWTVQNNFVSLTNGSNTNGVKLLGIWDWPGATYTSNVYYNTVYVAGTSVAGAETTQAYLRNSGGTSVVKDNIFYNARTGGTGNHYALSDINTIPGTLLTSNFNDLFAVNPATVGEWGATVAQDFVQWKASSGGDANSVSVQPVFISSTDLHLDPANNSSLDNLGDPITGITTDIDGQTRGTGVVPSPDAPDMGADEFAAGSVPVTLVYFKGSKQNSGHQLDWKVTCYNSPTVTMVLERSADGRKFTSINNQTETSLRCLQPFSFVDAAPLSGINYYRLKSIDIDGKETYSNIVALLNKEKGFEMLNLVPNPVKDDAILIVTSAVKSSMEIVVSDLSSKQLYKQRVSMIAGNNQLPLNVRNLPAGIYQVTGITADGMTRTLRFVKQ